ncbi:hypothetical protein NST04_12550 [Paenibacillus sp. FSL H7-0756]|uniref:hypothetical protein n=1 Tax=unclassified Paenibacillus TaxID=185978 RepID=UPI0030F827B9
MNQRKIVNLTVIILIICIFYYFFVSGGTAAVGRIEKLFLKEKESYFMAYKYNLLRKPYLVKIKEDEI